MINVLPHGYLASAPPPYPPMQQLPQPQPMHHHHHHPHMQPLHPQQQAPPQQLVGHPHAHPQQPQQAQYLMPSYPVAPAPMPHQMAGPVQMLPPPQQQYTAVAPPPQQVAQPQVLYYVVNTPQGQQLVPVQQTTTAYPPQLQPPSSSPPLSASTSQTGAAMTYVQPQFVHLANGSQTTVPSAPPPTSYYLVQPMASTPIPGADSSSSHVMIPMSGSTSHSASTTVRPPTDVNIWGFAVVDQYHPSLQRIPVPPSVVSRTRGTASYNNDVQASSTKPCSSTVCLRFSSRNAPPSENCPAGEHCTGFHVERSYLEAARRVSEPLCCSLHNDYFSQEMLHSDCAPQLANQRFTLVLDDRAEVELTLSQVALTIGLDQLTSRGSAGGMQNRVISLRKQVCRLHYEGKCKWTKDCGHVHLCRELHRFLLSFHFPSLSFLLFTETNVARLVTKLNEEPQLLQYVKSKCVLPMASQLLDAKKYAALEAIMSVGGCLTPAMKEVLEAHLAASSTTATDQANSALRRALSNAVLVEVPEAVQARFRPFQRPPPNSTSPSSATTTTTVGSAMLASPGKSTQSTTPTHLFTTVDPTSIWGSPPNIMEDGAAAPSSPTTTRMPAFSPGASVTSLQGRPEGRSQN